MVQSHNRKLYNDLYTASKTWRATRAATPREALHSSKRKKDGRNYTAVRGKRSTVESGKTPKLHLPQSHGTSTGSGSNRTRKRRRWTCTHETKLTNRKYKPIH